ncbi:unnamed protein product [Pseudo-nitzschia multistriata]|uniref:Hint domain-containing protein n=1 Tax=Pseudo-nitzschia multistriata TaxID=183589 RepID=A0A448ZDE9_9STRA|nr:unnamed protein product [Pseudo-nitzschia multistriata]
MASATTTSCSSRNIRSVASFAALLFALACLGNGSYTAAQPSNPSTPPCRFLDDAPPLDVEIPSVLTHKKLSFLGVAAKVHRKATASGSKPRLRFLRYSSTPTVDVTRGGILVSAEGSGCDVSVVDSILSSSAPSRSTPRRLLAASAVAAGFLSSHKLGMLIAVLCLSSPSLVPGSAFAEAASSSTCTPSMEIVLEAPPYYLGSVEECLRSVSNPDHCPEPFPEFPICGADDRELAAPACKLAVVGAGTGGLYTAYRLVEEGVFEGSDICIFEATDRVGGRIYSLRGFGPEGDISVDAGAYRTWPDYTPTTHALITEVLGFDVECYDEDDPCTKFNIVGETGEKIGFASFVEELMSRLIEKGACFFPRHNLVSVAHNNDDAETDGYASNTLTFSNGVKTRATHGTILNVPQRALLEILRESKDLFSSSSSSPSSIASGTNLDRSAREEEKRTYDSLHSVQTEIVTKLYLYYEDAWWYKLGLTQGDFSLPGDARSMLLEGRYHDGHVKCEATDDGDEKCYGFLLAVYAHDFSGTKAQYFRRFQRDRPEPVTILSDTNPEEEDFLRHAHERLVDYHVYGEDNARLLNASAYSPFQFRKIIESSPPPTFAVLANWNTAAFGAGGGWHHWTDTANAEKAMKPLNPLGIHVVNEAFSKIQGWAEGSLLLADEILEEHYGVARPWSFEVPQSIFYLAQTSSEECVAGDDAGSGQSGGSSSSGGAGPVAGELDLCFAAGSLVEMANGNLVPIEDVEEGDSVATGVGGKIGLVTEKLVHPVRMKEAKKTAWGAPYRTRRWSDVVVVPTEHGDLVGTPDHPVLLGNSSEWMELGDALERNLLAVGARRVSRDVDIFYNLEIDGHKVYKDDGRQAQQSPHSYVVNGVVASGLGDNPLLNRLFPRQRVFLEEQSKHHHDIDLISATSIVDKT